jgi:hypothetical protein
MEAEISRLISENNSLHSQVIKEKQMGDSADSKLILLAKREQEAKKDFEFMIGAKEGRIKSLNEENMHLRSKLEELVRKSLEGANSDKAGNTSLELKRKVAEVNNICLELKSECKLVAHLTAALKKQEEELLVAKAMLVNVESKRLQYKNEAESRTQELLNKDREIERLQVRSSKDGLVNLQDFWTKNYSEYPFFTKPNEQN